MKNVARVTAIFPRRLHPDSLYGYGAETQWLIEQSHVDATHVAAVGHDKIIAQTGQTRAVAEVVDHGVVFYLTKSHERQGLGPAG